MLDLTTARLQIDERNRIRVDANLPLLSPAKELRRIYLADRREAVRGLPSNVAKAERRRPTGYNCLDGEQRRRSICLDPEAKNAARRADLGRLGEGIRGIGTDAPGVDGE